MEPHTSEVQNVLNRLDKLERQNRRLKQAAVAALVLATALATIYATQPVPQKITAHEFEVVDNSGSVRVKIGMSMSPAGPTLALFDTSGNPVAELQTVGVPDDMISSLSLYDPEQKTMAQISNISGTPLVQVTGPLGASRAYMAVFEHGDPAMSISDSQGFEMDLGNMEISKLRTGETQRTSAASIVMFGNDKKHSVIWKAP